MKANGITKYVPFISNDSWYYRIIIAVKWWQKKASIDPYFSQHNTYVEIAEIERMSLSNTNAIIKEEESGRQKYQHQQEQEEISKVLQTIFSKT